MTPHDILLRIQEMLDGVEWTADTLDEIAQLLHANGYRLRDLEEVFRTPPLAKCGQPGCSFCDDDGEYDG